MSSLENVLTATLNFNHRVKEFIKTIVTNEYNDMCVKYYNYRVEFQMRGAGHIHGTLWIDWSKLKKHMEQEKDKETFLDIELIVAAFETIKKKTFGTKSCHKYGPECRFGAPWFPSLRTIIAVPHNIRYSNPEVAEKSTERIKAFVKKS